MNNKKNTTTYNYWAFIYKHNKHKIIISALTFNKALNKKFNVP